MKRFILALILLCAVAGSGCHRPITLTTPQGQTAYTADQIVVRVNELMNAAITAEANGSLPRPAARKIVTFAVDADKTLAATPAGWQTTLKTAWAAAKPDIGTPSNIVIVSLLAAVDAAIGSL